MNNLELVKQYAKAWNNLDINYLEPYLSDDYHYESQHVFSAITSKAEYLEYLSGKFNTIRKTKEDSNSFLSAEIGYYNNEPCLILIQINDKPIEAVLLIKFKDGQIIRGDMCMIPTVNEVRRTGGIPF